MKVLLTALASLALVSTASAQQFREVVTATVASGDTAVTTALGHEDREILAIVSQLPNGVGSTWTVRLQTASDVLVADWASLAENTTHYLEPSDASEISGDAIFTTAGPWEVVHTSATAETSGAVNVTTEIIYREPQI